MLRLIPLKFLTPQIILTQHTKEQTAEEVVAANFANFKSARSTEGLITEYDEEIYCIFGNYLHFSHLRNSNYVFREVDEFQSRFMKGFSQHSV